VLHRLADRIGPDGVRAVHGPPRPV
jgi:hypothetical protein